MSPTMRSSRLAPLLLALCACGEEPVQVQEADATASRPEPPEPQPQTPPQPEVLERGEGLVVEVLERGHGPAARRGSEVAVHYLARLADSELPLDSSWSRGVPERWRLSARGKPRLIEGLVRGLEGLPAGTRAVLRIPAALAWGVQGLESAGIPPDADVVYEVHLVEVAP